MNLINLRSSCHHSSRVRWESEFIHWKEYTGQVKFHLLSGYAVGMSAFYVGAELFS